MAQQPTPIDVAKMHNDTQKGLAETVNAIVHEGLRGEAALARVAEDVPPSVMFHHAVRANGLLYRLIRDIMLQLGVTVEKKSGYMVIRALAEMYPTEELRSDALALIDDRRTTPRAVTPEQTAQHAQPAVGNDSHRAVSSLLGMYRDANSKYGGTICSITGQLRN
jgi:hypothetical protein